SDERVGESHPAAGRDPHPAARAAPPQARPPAPRRCHARVRALRGSRRLQRDVPVLCLSEPGSLRHAVTTPGRRL
ncbi:MAG: hypothetical protein AAB425_03290, partial [Bdellovibrionota bacterium]